MLSSEIVMPFVRVVVVNYDGGDVTMRCLRSLQEIDYPQERLDVVVVDNGSVDGLVWKIPQVFPNVRIIESFTNEGFARGNNLAMENLEGVDVVALLNNDAIADSNWLRPLVASLFSEESNGATCSKMLFNRNVIGLEISPPNSAVCISDVLVNGVQSLHNCSFDERFDRSGLGYGALTAQYWLTRSASFWVDAPVDQRRESTMLSVKLHSQTDNCVRVRFGQIDSTLMLTPTPTWFEFEFFDHMRVINNAGGGIFAGLHAGDLGFKELDLGQYEEQKEVFSFCGGAVALKSAFLKDVGLFDPTYFLYYEDLDLAWRGHYAGWSYLYVPESIVLHEHAYSSGAGSAFFKFWVDRNRRLTLIKNAPARIAFRAFAGAILWCVRDTVRPLMRSLVRLRRPPVKKIKYRLRQLGSFLKAVPHAYQFRRKQLKRSPIKPKFVYEWISKR
jgi:GT2 family glycosyltransferase